MNGKRERPGFPARLNPNPSTSPRTETRPSPRQPAAPRIVPAPLRGFDQQRLDMVRQLAAQGVRDARVLDAMNRVERHRFVDAALMRQAYEDTSLPIGLGQTISKPNVVARMIELLLDCPALSGAPGGTPGEGDAAGRRRVLEIGTGCGYQAAVLGQVAREVYSIERLRGLHEKARVNLRALRLPNVHLIFGDGMVGYAQGAPYAGIIAAAGGEAVPQAWVEQLAVGGRLVAPVAYQEIGGQARQALMVLDKTPAGVQQTLLEAVNFVPLKSGIA